MLTQPCRHARQWPAGDELDQPREVDYIVRRLQGADDASEVVRDLRPQLLLDLPTTERVLEAARIKADHPMAYADAFAAATAIAHNATLLTGDPELLVTGAAWGTEDLRATAESDSDSE